MSNQFQKSSYCIESAIWAQQNLAMVFNCTREMNTHFIKNQLQKCQKSGRRVDSCSLSFEDEESGEMGVFNDFGDFEDLKKSCNGKSYFYIQAPCLIPAQNHSKRQIIGLVVASIASFTYLFSQLFFEYMLNVQRNKFVDYDVRTITAADYSAEFTIRESQYNFWKEHFLKEDNPMSEMA